MVPQMHMAAHTPKLPKKKKTTMLRLIAKALLSAAECVVAIMVALEAAVPAVEAVAVIHCDC